MVLGTRYCSATDLTDEKAIQSSGTRTAAAKKARMAWRAIVEVRRVRPTAEPAARMCVRAATSGPLVPEEAVLQDDENAHDQPAEGGDRPGVGHAQPPLPERD